jgi:hypothetical protein
MRKVHITLVGGQPAPVYLGIKDDGQANTVVLVCSPQSRVEAERIKEQFPKRTMIVRECHPVLLQEIETLAMELYEEFSDYEIVVNLTSGTKLWSLTFFRVFYKSAHSHFIYIDQNNSITDILTKDSHVGTINTLKRFELYGTPLTSFRLLNEYDENDLKVATEIEKLRKKSKSEFHQLTVKGDFREQEDRIVRNTENGSSLEFSLEENWAVVQLYCSYSKRFEKREFCCQHLFQLLFNYGWFELKTANELRKNERIGNIWLNCEFADSGGNPKNEIDIIAELENRLLFVECKTMIRDTTDIDKFSSALRNFSGTSSTGIFVTNDMPTDLSRPRYEHALEKCKDNGILTFNFSVCKSDPVGCPPLNAIINEQLQFQNKR